jgi:hypothetical protein
VTFENIYFGYTGDGVSSTEVVYGDASPQPLQLVQGGVVVLQSPDADGLINVEAQAACL